MTYFHTQVLSSHILVQCCVMVIQTAVTLSTIILGGGQMFSSNIRPSGFGIPCRGPLIWLAGITMLQVPVKGQFSFGNEWNLKMSSCRVLLWWGSSGQTTNDDHPKIVHIPNILTPKIFKPPEYRTPQNYYPKKILAPKKY